MKMFKKRVDPRKEYRDLYQRKIDNKKRIPHINIYAVMPMLEIVARHHMKKKWWWFLGIRKIILKTVVQGQVDEILKFCATRHPKGTVYWMKPDVFRKRRGLS